MAGRAPEFPTRSSKKEDFLRFAAQHGLDADDLFDGLKFSKNADKDEAIVRLRAAVGGGGGGAEAARPPAPPAPAPAPRMAPVARRHRAGHRGTAHEPLAAVATQSHHTWRTQLIPFVRDDVSKLCAGQRGNGAYELRPLRAGAEGEAPQVDHVFECQVMSDVLFRTEALRPVLRAVEWDGVEVKTFAKQPEVVKSALEHARHVHNSEEFLVVCSAHANKKKEGAFRTCLNHLSKGRALGADFRIRDELERVFTDPKGVRPFGDDEAQGMAREVERRLKEMEDRHTALLRDVGQGLGAAGRQRVARYENIADEVVLMYETFGLQSDR